MIAGNPASFETDIIKRRLSTPRHKYASFNYFDRISYNQSNEIEQVGIVDADSTPTPALPTNL